MTIGYLISFSEHSVCLRPQDDFFTALLYWRSKFSR